MNQADRERLLERLRTIAPPEPPPRRPARRDEPEAAEPWPPAWAALPNLDELERLSRPDIEATDGTPRHVLTGPSWPFSLP